MIAVKTLFLGIGPATVLQFSTDDVTQQALPSQAAAKPDSALVSILKAPVACVGIMLAWPKCLPHSRVPDQQAARLMQHQHMLLNSCCVRDCAAQGYQVTISSQLDSQLHLSMTNAIDAKNVACMQAGHSACTCQGAGCRDGKGETGWDTL